VAPLAVDLFLADFYFVLFFSCPESYLLHLQVFGMVSDERASASFSLTSPVLEDLREFEAAHTSKMERPHHYWVVYRIFKKVIEWNPIFLHAMCLLCVSRFHGLTEGELMRTLCGGSLQPISTGSNNFRRASIAYSRRKQGPVVKGGKPMGENVVAESDKFKRPQADFLVASQFEFALLKPLLTHFVNVCDGVMTLSQPVYYEVISECFLVHDRRNEFVPSDTKVSDISPSTSTRTAVRGGNLIRNDSKRSRNLLSSSPMKSDKGPSVLSRRRKDRGTTRYQINKSRKAIFKTMLHYLSGLYLALHEGPVSNHCARLLLFCLFQVMAEAHKKEDYDDAVEVAKSMRQLLLNSDVDRYLFTGPRVPPQIPDDVALDFQFSGILSEGYQCPELYALTASISSSGGTSASDDICGALIGSFVKTHLHHHHKVAKVLFHKCAEAGEKL
jgi:hypothetical protein